MPVCFRIRAFTGIAAGGAAALAHAEMARKAKVGRAEKPRKAKVRRAEKPREAKESQWKPTFSSCRPRESGDPYGTSANELLRPMHFAGDMGPRFRGDDRCW